MQTNANGSSYSVATQTLHRSTSGYAVPITPGESMYSLDRQEMANRVMVAYPDDFCSAQQGRDSRSFQKNAASYPQHASFQETYHQFRDKNQESLILSSDDYTFDHPFSTSSSSNIAEHNGYEGLPFAPKNDEWPGFRGLLVSEHSSSFDSCGDLQVPGSRFVHAVQEILTEVTRYAIGDGKRVGYTSVDLSDGGHQGYMLGNRILQEREVVAMKKHLLALLQVVDDRYNQCVDEIHTVTSAFHAVTELDPNLHVRFVLPAISSMYKNLRERISSHILALGSSHDRNNEGETRDDQSFEAHFIRRQWALQQLSKRDHQLWRPQRGLPEKSVSVLRTWLFQNFLHPYPKDAAKHLLALQSGLTRNQVSNWFINARVRLWKPMIEEMYAEMNRRRKRGEQ